MGPGCGDHVILELQDRQERVATDWLDSEPGTCQDLAVLALNPVIERELQSSAKQDVDESSGWCGGRQEAGHQDVGIQHPDGYVIHAWPSACELDARP